MNSTSGSAAEYDLAAVGWRPWFGFVVLCGALASSWLLPPTSPSSVLVASALAYSLVAAVLLAAFGTRLHRSSPLPGSEDVPRASLRVLWSAVGVVGAPLVLLQFGADLCGSTLSTAALCTAPLWVATTLAARNGDPLGQSLVPTLAGLAGSLLLLPIAEPSSVRAAVGLALSLAAAALAGVSAVVCHTEMRRVEAGPAVLLAAGANAALLWTAILCLPPLRRGAISASQAELLLRLLWEMMGSALLLWLLRSISPLAFATRFFWIPLIVAAEGYALLRPPISFRVVAGAGLLAVAGAVLVRRSASVPEEIPSLR